jgi:hypothetical protein
MILFTAQSVHAAATYEETEEGDDRLIRTSSSPSWLAAVGSFRINNRQNTNAKACSAFLISANKTDDAIVTLVAAHCVNDFRTGGRPTPENFAPTRHTLVFTTNDGRKIDRQIVAVEGYDYMEGDYAIVILNEKILNSDIQPLVHSDEKFKSGGYGLLEDPAYELVFKPFATAAGYSADIPFGDKGNHLTYDEDCYLNGGTSGQKDSKCWSYGGASGGPIVITIDRGVDEWEERPLMGTEHLAVGIIKGGLNGDNSRSYWTPASFYNDVLLAVFRKYGIKRNW